jgi:interleukin-1 receptor-associated kinase 1
MAREVVVQRWRAPVVAEQHYVEADPVDYADLSDATGDFCEMFVIGGGGSCKVYRGELYGLAVAIKALDTDWKKEPPRGEEGERAASTDEVDDWNKLQFKAEMDLLNHVRHDNICRLFAMSSNGPQQCLVLEWMTGGSLDARLASSANGSGETAHPPLAWKHRTSILVQVARGMAHLHSMCPPLIHRDIKCANGESNLHLMSMSERSIPIFISM